MAPSNTAAWITGPKVSPLEVKEAPYTSPGPGQVVIKTVVVAVNPLEYKIQDCNPPVGGKEITYPTILGADLAGTVVETGEGVLRRKVGDKILANAHGTRVGDPAMSAFQEFVLLPESSTTALPSSYTFEQGAVLPLACDTAVAGLFVHTQLGLSTSGLGDRQADEPAAGSSILIWAGSSSGGCCAIQMSRAAGYKVYTTASKRNHALCKQLGATEVFDYNDANIESAIVTAKQGRWVVWALDCIAEKDTTVTACARILSQTSGQTLVVTVLAPPESGLSDGVKVQRVSIPSLRGSTTYEKVHQWMEKALAMGTLQPKPDPRVVGKGLESIQLGIDTMRNRVSASKVVVVL